MPRVQSFTVVVASRNSGKLAELSPLLMPLGWTLGAVSDYTDAEVEETAPTFIENALLKARHASRISGLPALADDSGLEVDALDGQPGVHSARFAGPGATAGANNEKLLSLMRGVPEARRGARFVCVLAFLRHASDPAPIIAQGFWRGTILPEPRGAQGFGYDPLFQVPGHGCSAAELPPAIKRQLSHRGRAMSQLRAQLQGLGEQG